MTVTLDAVCFAALDPPGLARFWAGLLGWQLDEGPPDGPLLRPDDDTGFVLRFRPTSEPKSRKNQLHFDLTSASAADQQQTVARAVELGGRHVDIGQRPEEGHVVLADPEGNELCVIAAGNAFLADCGFLGAVACDGSRSAGEFWSRALDWPLVWDQGEETAIRSPHGGPKITWGGPPFPAKTAERRLHFDLVPVPGGDRQVEVERLLALGATRTAAGGGDGETVVLLDPDGNEFCVLPGQGLTGQHP